VLQERLVLLVQLVQPVPRQLCRDQLDLLAQLGLVLMLFR
jgi:hypothetical protein